MTDVLPWQVDLWRQLAGRAQHAHAYLLHGPAGIGKRLLAEQLMALLLCQRPVEARACGECKACQLLAAQTHPDHYVLEPEEVDKAIRVDQVRDLVGFVTQTAQLGGRKVILLEPAEAMNLNAANALLKSLEEPSGDTVLLLISHQPSRLLPTIKSRCVQQACPLPGRQQSLDWLAARLPELGPELREQLLTLAAGSPLAALKLHEQKVLQYLAQKSSQQKVIALQDWLLEHRQKVLGKANLNRVLLLEALLVQWATLPGAG